MQTISVSELRQNLILYLEKAEDGDEIIIEDENRVIARILPVDTNGEETRLVAEGLMRLPKKSLDQDFWEADTPEIYLDKTVGAIRSERDEN